MLERIIVCLGSTRIFVWGAACAWRAVRLAL